MTVVLCARCRAAPVCARSKIAPDLCYSCVRKVDRPTSTDELDDEDLDALCAETPIEIPPEVKPVFEAVTRVPIRSVYSLTPDTKPQAFAASQWDEVERFFADRPGASEQDASEALVLPVWSIRCRLAELKGEPVPYTALQRKTA